MPKNQKSLGKHLVRYVENCSPKLKFFNKKDDVQKFVLKFVKKHPYPDDGYWVEFVCYDVGQFETFETDLSLELA